MRPLPRKVIKGMKVMDELIETNSANEEVEPPLDSPVVTFP